MNMSIALSLHVLFVVIWVGGMFFAYIALRPAAAMSLDPPQRLSLWSAVFARFFPWVWASIAVVLGTGYWMLFGPFGGFANAPVFVHIMHTLALIMTLMFFHVFFAPYKRLRQAVESQDWLKGAKALGQMRILIAINLTIGLITVLIATAGKFFI
jgi:uncharacterized membrane protein